MKVPLLIFTLLVIEACCVVKMIKLFGNVTESSKLDFSYGESIEECIIPCFSTPECILVQYNPYTCFQFGTDNQMLTVVEANEDSYVAFKVNLPNTTCPVSYKDLNFSTTSDTGATYSWKKDGTSWEFYGCREEWKRFERADGSVVCMNAIIAAETTIDDARKACEGQNSVLTGVASVEESKWILGVVKTLGPKAEDNYGFWIDGKRNCSAEPCNKFYWTDGYTTTFDALEGPSSAVLSEKFQGAWKDCLTIAPLNNGASINDMPCDTKNILGFVCGYKSGSLW